MSQAKLLSAGLLLALSGTTTVLWPAAGPAADEPRSAGPKGPYKVVLSRPIAVPGRKVGTLYTEHEYLTEMANQLDQDGLRPVFTELLPAGIGQGDQEVRLLLLCVPK